MARTSAENSATSQFYINTVDNLFLDGTLNSPGYAVFGRVVAGADTTLQALRAVQVVNNGAGEVSLPVNPPVILSATRVR
jgi:peptidyl-prolyl cis-trans isomerase A (cyclophilin A)